MDDPKVHVFVKIFMAHFLFMLSTCG